MNESGTPRTDAMIAKLEGELGDGPPHISTAAIDVAVRLRLTDHARKLERELAAERGRIAGDQQRLFHYEAAITAAQERISGYQGSRNYAIELLAGALGIAPDKVRAVEYYAQRTAGALSSAQTVIVEMQKELECTRKAVEAERERSGVYGASRVKHADMWKALREVGYQFNQSWIDEAGEGETADFSELWEHIAAEVKRSQALILYVEPDDFPLKGALIECGIAMASNVPIIVCAPGVEVEGRTMRPLGSWILSKRVQRIDVITDALAAIRALTNDAPTTDGRGA